jgi:hypothetical protein
MRIIFRIYMDVILSFTFFHQNSLFSKYNRIDRYKLENTDKWHTRIFTEFKNNFK